MEYDSPAYLHITQFLLENQILESGSQNMNIYGQK